jgi:hypothetical protein
MSQVKSSNLQADLTQNMKSNKDSMSDAVPKIDNTKFDRMGVWVTGLCALHCLLLPLFISVIPFIASSFVASAWFERTILSVSILVGFVALLIGFNQYHRQLYPMYSLTLGGLIYWNKDMFGHAYEPLAILLGAVFIIAAHLVNLRLCRKCKTC